jgi:hypothetical protein
MVGLWCTRCIFLVQCSLKYKLLHLVCIQVNTNLFQWQKNNSCVILETVWLCVSFMSNIRDIWGLSDKKASTWSTDLSLTCIGTTLWLCSHTQLQCAPIWSASIGLLFSLLGEQVWTVWSMLSLLVLWILVSHFHRWHIGASQITEATTRHPTFLLYLHFSFLPRTNHCFLGPFHSHHQFWELPSLAGQIHIHSILITSHESCANEDKMNNPSSWWQSWNWNPLCYAAFMS